MVRRSVLAALAGLTLLAACTDAREAGTSSAPGHDAPIEVTSCDRTQRLDGPAQRIVSLNQHVTEVLLDLGLADRIVGIGYAGAFDGPAAYADVVDRLPALADEYPGRERLLDAEPDLVVGGMASAFDAKEGRGRADLEAHGIATFLFAEYCAEQPVDVDLVVEDLHRLGTITGTRAEAEALADDLVDRLAEVAERLEAAGVEPVPTFVYDSGEKQPMTVGGVGIGQVVLEHAGADNLFAELDRPYGDTSWEQVAERAPEAVVVLDYGDTPVEEKRAFLRDQPLARTTPAVADDRIVELPLRDLFQGPRMANAVEALARALHPEVFGG